MVSPGTLASSTTGLSREKVTSDLGLDSGVPGYSGIIHNPIVMTQTTIDTCGTGQLRGFPFNIQLIGKCWFGTGKCGQLSEELSNERMVTSRGLTLYGRKSDDKRNCKDFVVMIAVGGFKGRQP